MIGRQILAIVAPTVARSVRRWIFHLGGLGFIPLGLLDSSVIPLPGSMDVLTIILSTRKQDLWLYYALMATIGSVIGGYVTYRLARKGGKETLERKFPARTLEKVYRIFGRWGFGAIAIAALLPRRCYGSISLAAGASIFRAKIPGGLTGGGLSDIPSWRSWQPTMGGKCSRSCRNSDGRSSSPLSD
jgi:membrane protein YqaA with SNARE-associated domain